MKKRNSNSPKPKQKRGRKGKKPHKKNNLESMLRKELLAFLRKNPKQSYSAKQIGSQTGLWSQVNNQKIRSVLDKLAASGHVNYESKGKYRFATIKQFATGKLEVTRSGVGFLIREEGEDVFIAAGNLDKGMHGDLVKVKMLQRRRRKGDSRPEGEVVEIIHRARTQFVGTVEEGLPGTFFLLPDDPRLKVDFFLPKHKLKRAKAGDKVLVQLLNWEKRAPEAEVLQVLGEAGEHNTEMHAILLQYGFDPNFPPEVEQEAAKIPVEISQSEIKKRRDMRGIHTFTIDPIDAKDFDDALSLRQLENGNWEVGVHIADVSHYVKPGTALDREAFFRGTSVYLVDRTVPMLPEKLSNEVCSLRPKEDKLTYSAVFEMDNQARVKQYWIGRTIIHSDYRFHYDEAQEVIEGKTEGPFKAELDTLHQLAQTLRQNRLGTGSIEFESHDVKFVLDENDKPIKVLKREMKDANFLIEDFMLLANRTVAAYIHGLQQNPPLPSVYRVHDRPDPEKLGSLQQFVKAFGYEVDLQKQEDLSGRLNGLLRKVQDKPEQNVISTLAIRSMAKAVYSTQNIGHFGLGFAFYTHFTSPIRRYPDLLVHRLLTAYHQKQYQVNPVVLEEQCKHSSEKEKTATEAERASIKYKQVEFLSERIGEEFDGVVSGVIESGFFVELKENFCEGFVPVRTLDDDYYVYDENQYALVGKDTGKMIRLGDEVRVEIDGTDMQRRTVDMVLVGEE